MSKTNEFPASASPQAHTGEPTRNGTLSDRVRSLRLADRAAKGGITAVNPFQPLPATFRGEYLALRFRFLYNPDRNQLR